MSRQWSVDTGKETFVYVSKGESGLNNILSYTVGTPSASRARSVMVSKMAHKHWRLITSERGAGVKECS